MSARWISTKRILFFPIIVIIEICQEEKKKVDYQK